MNKLAELTKIKTLYNAAKGILRIKQAAYPASNMNYRDGKYYGRGDLSAWGNQIAEERQRLNTIFDNVKNKDRWQATYDERSKALDDLEANLNEYNNINKDNLLRYEDGRYTGTGSAKTWRDKMDTTRRRLELMQGFMRTDKMPSDMQKNFNERFNALNEFDKDYSPIASYIQSNPQGGIDKNTGKITGNPDINAYEAAVDTAYNLFSKDTQANTISRYNDIKRSIDEYRVDPGTNTPSVEPGYTRDWNTDIWNYDPTSEKSTQTPSDNSIIYGSGATDENIADIRNLADERSKLAPFAKPANIVLSDADTSYHQATLMPSNRGVVMLGGYAIENPNYTDAMRNTVYKPGKSGDFLIDDYYYHSPGTFWHELGHKDYSDLYSSTANEDASLGTGYADFKKLREGKLDIDSMSDQEKEMFNKGQREVARKEYPSTLQQIGFIAQSPENWLNLYNGKSPNVQNVLGSSPIYNQINQFEHMGYVPPYLANGTEPNYDAEQLTSNEETVEKMKGEIDALVNNPDIDPIEKQLKYKYILRKYLPTNVYNMAMKGRSMPITSAASEINDNRYKEPRQWLTEQIKQELAGATQGGNLPWNLGQYLMENDIDPSMDFSNPGNVLSYQQLLDLYKKIKQYKYIDKAEGAYGTNWQYGA